MYRVILLLETLKKLVDSLRKLYNYRNLSDLTFCVIAAALTYLKDLHYTQSTMERSKYYKHNQKAKDGGKRQHLCRYMSIIVDGMDQAKTRPPHWNRPPKYMDDKRQVDLHLFGAIVVAHGVGPSMSGTECHVHWNVKQSFKDDSNATCTMIESLIKSVQTQRAQQDKPMPEVLYIQLDNVGTNKNHWLIAYACWLVQKGIFIKIKINFLLVGHTHENIDQFFSRLSVALQSERAFTLDQMIEIVKGCAKPQPMNTVVTEMIDFKKWLTDAKCAHTYNIKKSHIFRIKKNLAGRTVVQSKQYSTSAFYGPEFVSIPEKIDETRYKVFPHPMAPIDVVTKNGTENKSIVDLLKETARLLDDHQPYGWDDTTKLWWDNFLEDLESHHVRPDRVQCEDHGLLKCVETPREAPIDISDPSLTAEEVEMVQPEFADISSRPTSVSWNVRRCADPKDMVVGQMVCMMPEDGQSSIANNDRAADIVTPVWIGKILKLVDNRIIKVHWYGADFGRKDPPPSGDANMDSEEIWMKWQWTPRYSAQARSTPVSSEVDRYECGLLAYAFELKDVSPKGGMRKAAVKLIRERYQACLRENALGDEDL